MSSLSSPSSLSPSQSLLITCDVVCFDVDSTVQLDEGIDVLAEFAGKAEQVKALTTSAMSGTMKFEDTLKARLDLIKPTTTMLAECLKKHPVRFSPLLPEFIALLRKRGKHVFLVSGGFSAMIHPIADALELPRSHVFANEILFDCDGNYAGFDPTCFTSKSGGKAKAVAHIIEEITTSKKKKTKQTESETQQKQQQEATSEEKTCQLSTLTTTTTKLVTAIMIGDGATDLEAKPPADAVIGYGGVVVREKVKAEADWFVTSFQELIDVFAV